MSNKLLDAVRDELFRFLDKNPNASIDEIKDKFDDELNDEYLLDLVQREGFYNVEDYLGYLLEEEYCGVYYE